MTKLPVIFRTDRRSGECVAIFPTLMEGIYMTCYAHIGQHSTCSRAWYHGDTRRSTDEECADLLRELTGIYDDCQLVRRYRINRSN